ncbi:MAG: hypothetical protein EAZ27_14280, partial [Cytophagales bacterium]
MSYANIREEELKNKISQDYFWMYDCTKIIGNVDFCVSMLSESSNSELELDHESLFWAEAKKGISDIQKSIVQLILTIGKARTFDKFLPPAFVGAFDAEKIAFIPYSEISEIFYQNDFNWNVTPSNYETKEFKLLLNKVINILNVNALLFNYETDNQELTTFIKDNFVVGKFGVTKTQIDKNNFMIIYNKWLGAVKPTIVINWEIAKKNNIIDGDFYLADLLSSENETLKEKLSVILKQDFYELEKKLDDMGMFGSKTTRFNDKQKAHTQFWLKYERPPKEQYWDYIVERRDLLVPQDVRERKGSFFTPQIWVELSQKYLADVLGQDWQDEYYIWDCAAGTGNLLAGLTNKNHIWASTLDRQDVDVMKDRIQNGANLLEDHVFQFDFLNDSFDKLPKSLLDVITNPEKRKKMVVYINPPYAEAGSVSVIGDRKNKISVATESKIWNKYKDILGLAIRELFAQFFVRINEEIPDCNMAVFSKLKYINGDGFKDFRKIFDAKFKSGFIVPATSFDNVSGNFPIGFLIWDLKSRNRINKIETDIYNKNGLNLGKKSFYTDINIKRVTGWISKFELKNKNHIIGYTGNNGPDYQNNAYLHISSLCKMNKNGTLNNATKYFITKRNLLEICIYFSIRHCINATWLNDRDQFLHPNIKWEKDKNFQNDCLVFALFHGQNRITAKHGTNNWIPFSENSVNARDNFESNFMVNFIQGKLKEDKESELFQKEPLRKTPLIFSAEAEKVFEAGKKLWEYYHQEIKKIPISELKTETLNASLYDIREYFQGRSEKRMNNKSEDDIYSKLMEDLRESLKILASKIEPKVYEYGFL